MSSVPRVIVKARKARPFFARHPWVLAGSIDSVEGEPAVGAEVAVHAHEGKFIARGLWNPESVLRVRLYRWSEDPLDREFWAKRIESAVQLRRELYDLDAPRSAARLIYAESDGLSGLIVDRYGEHLVVQFHSRALFERREAILEALQATVPCSVVIVRTDSAIARKEGLPTIDEVVLGKLPEDPVPIVVNDVLFLVDIGRGQKTGFYLDQSANRRAVSEFAEGKRVLDLFCYSGGFGITALKRGGAASALGIDSSEHAIDLARRNALANGLGKARFEKADVFAALEALAKAGERFDLVVCDPPKYADRPGAVEAALRGYLRLNLAALEVVAPDGFLVTCSCSGHVDRELFVELLGQVAERSGRDIRILDQRGQAPDHPVSASCPETDYLKCLICRVD